MNVYLLAGLISIQRDQSFHVLLPKLYPESCLEQTKPKNLTDLFEKKILNDYKKIVLITSNLRTS